MTTDYIPEKRETSSQPPGGPVGAWKRLLRRMMNCLPVSRTELMQDVMARDIDGFDRRNRRWDYDQRSAMAQKAHASGLPIEAAEDLYGVTLSDCTDKATKIDRT